MVYDDTYFRSKPAMPDRLADLAAMVERVLREIAPGIFWGSIILGFGLPNIIG